MSTPSTPVTTAQFRRDFAAAIIALQTKTAVENNDMARRLSQFGIGAEPAAGNTSGVRPVVTEQDPKMVGKLRFSDLNSAAQDRLRAQELQRLMRQAYGYLRMRVGSSWTL